MVLLNITSVCFRVISELIHLLSRPKSTQNDENSIPKSQAPPPVDDLMRKALTAVFGMETNGKIKKEKARKVVENLGMIVNEEENSCFDLSGEENEEVLVEKVLVEIEEEKSKRGDELLRQAFNVFDEDGNGYIDAIELKRVLQCLGLDNGWNMLEIEKTLKIVDLNLDGKVDFNEFELMMS